MAVNPVHLAILESQTNLKWGEVNGVDNQVGSTTITEEQAKDLQSKFDPKLGATIHASKSEPGKYRVWLTYDRVEQFITHNHPLYIAPDFLTRTERAQEKHGKGAIRFDHNTWEQVQAEVDFADRNKTRVVSLGSSDSRERLFFNQSAPKILELANRIAAKCQGKSVEEVLKIVNQEIDSLTTLHPSVQGQKREQIEKNLDARLDTYLEKRSKGLIPGKPRNLDVTMEELIQEGILVCRHKGLLAASIMGDLIDKKILPFGAARQYRSDIQDKGGKTRGAHAWSVYRDATTGDLWVNDPRWAQVKKVDFNHPEVIGYGLAALNKMIGRLELIDRPVIDAWKSKQSLIQEIISEINLRNLTMAIKGGDNRWEWISRLITQLNVIDNNDSFTAEQKNQRMMEVLSDMHLAANKDPQGTTAAVLFKNLLKELKDRIPQKAPVSELEKIMNQISLMHFTMAIRAGDNRVQIVNTLLEKIKKIDTDPALSDKEKQSQVINLLFDVYAKATTDNASPGTAAIIKEILKDLKIQLPRVAPVSFLADATNIKSPDVQQNANVQESKPGSLKKK